MTTFPTPYTVDVWPYLAGTKDTHGNPIDAWGEPITQKVYGWSSPDPSSEPTEAGRNAVIVNKILYAPPEFQVGPYDKITLPDGTFTVEGHANDYNHGPFGYRPGVTVTLERVEG